MPSSETRLGSRVAPRMARRLPNTDNRTAISSLLPRAGVGHTYPPDVSVRIPHPFAAACLLANLNSFAFDYAARQKVGGTALNYVLIRSSCQSLPHGRKYLTTSTRGGLPGRAGWSTGSSPASSNSPTPPGTCNPLPTTAATTARPSAGTRSAASCCAANSTPPTSTSTASAATTWTTSWRPSPSSSARTRQARRIPHQAGHSGEVRRNAARYRYRRPSLYAT